MTHPPFMQARSEGVILSIKLHPRASNDEIAGILGGELKIKVTAPPVDSAANEALLRLLADALDCPRSAIQLVRGQTSRHKRVLVRGYSIDDIARRLAS